MAWKKSPLQLVELLESVAPGPPAVPRQMFGYPAFFLGGNLFLGLFQDQLFLRLAENDRAELAARGGVPFAPMKDRPMREYVVAPEDLLEDERELGGWVARAVSHARSLPAKDGAAKARTGARKAAPKLNAVWHDSHPMPKGATKAQRIVWHAAHAKACGCRPAPASIAAEVAAVQKKPRRRA